MSLRFNEIFQMEAVLSHLNPEEIFTFLMLRQFIPIVS
jgi:hypothetical protein